MKTKFLFSLLAAMLLTVAQTYAKNIFVVEGSEDSYNQIRVVNETSQKDFNCRIVLLNEDETTKEVYGVYNLKEYKDSDINTKRFKQGDKFAIQMPKDFPVEVSFSLEYKDYPLFDAVVVHLTDKTTEFNED